MVFLRPAAAWLAADHRTRLQNSEMDLNYCGRSRRAPVRDQGDAHTDRFAAESPGVHNDLDRNTPQVALPPLVPPLAVASLRKAFLRRTALHDPLAAVDPLPFDVVAVGCDPVRGRDPRASVSLYHFVCDPRPPF